MTRRIAARRAPASQGTYEVLLGLIVMLDDDDVTIPCMLPSVDPEWWFTDTREAEALAKAACRTCPVIRVCRSHAIAADERGVWGATTRPERRAISGSMTSPAQVGDTGSVRQVAS